MGDQEQPLDAEFLMHNTLKPHPQWIERPLAPSAAVIDFADRQLRCCDSDFLIGAGAAVIRTEGKINQQHVKAEEAQHRPGADRDENHAGDKA